MLQSTDNPDRPSIGSIPEFYKEESNCVVNICISYNIIGSGFFIKLKNNNNDFYCLMTCYHIIKDIKPNQILNIRYNEDKSIDIELDKNKRFIKNYEYLNIDASIIEIK